MQPDLKDILQIRTLKVSTDANSKALYPAGRQDHMQTQEPSP